MIEKIQLEQINYYGQFGTTYQGLSMTTKIIQSSVVIIIMVIFLYFYYLSLKHPYVEVFEEFTNGSRYNLPEVEL